MKSSNKLMVVLPIPTAITMMLEKKQSSCINSTQSRMRRSSNRFSFYRSHHAVALLMMTLLSTMLPHFSHAVSFENSIVETTTGRISNESTTQEMQNSPNPVNIQTSDNDVVKVDSILIENKPDTSNVTEADLAISVKNSNYHDQEDNEILAAAAGDDMSHVQEVKQSPDFIYSDTALGENLEETIRSSVKNEIEMEQSIGSTTLHVLKEVDVGAETNGYHNVTDAVALIDNSQSNTDKIKDGEIFDADMSRQQQKADLNSSPTHIVVEEIQNEEPTILLPQKEKLVEREQTTDNGFRDSRKLDINLVSSNALRSDSKNDEKIIEEDAEIQTIEEEQQRVTHISLASMPQTENAINSLKNEDKEDNQNALENIIFQPSKLDSTNLDLPYLETTNLELSNLEHINQNLELQQQSEDQSDTLGTTFKLTTTTITETTTTTTTTTPKPTTTHSTEEGIGLSIVFNENLTATELPILLQNLLKVEGYIAETTISPEINENIHNVIKKQGVALDEIISDTDINNEELNTFIETTISSISVEDLQTTQSENIENDLSTTEPTSQTDAILMDKNRDQSEIEEPTDIIEDSNDLLLSENTSSSLTETTTEFILTSTTTNELNGSLQDDVAFDGSINKGSRSINTASSFHLDETAAAILFDTFPPRNSGQTFNDNLAAESSGGIGKALATIGENNAKNRSAIIIVLCSSTALLFISILVVIFLVSFHRQHGTLDIEMQEQRCGKDNLDDEDIETCTKLLDIELSSPIAIAAEEIDECL